MKKLLLISGIIIAGIGGTVYYYWQQFNYIPPQNNSSLTQLSNNPENLANLQQKQAEIKQKIHQDLQQKPAEIIPKNNQDLQQKPPNSQAKINQDLTQQKPVEINLTEENINTLIAHEISKNNQISPGIKSVNTKINQEQIETGIVINLSQIPTDKLSEQEKTALTNITQTFPMIANRDVYIAIVGKPTIENGKLKLDENTQIKIGNLSMKVSDIATQLGMDQDKFKKELNVPLALGNFKIEEIKLQDNQINLSVISK